MVTGELRERWRGWGGVGRTFIDVTDTGGDHGFVKFPLVCAALVSVKVKVRECSSQIE